MVTPTGMAVAIEKARGLRRSAEHAVGPARGDLLDIGAAAVATTVILLGGPPLAEAVGYVLDGIAGAVEAIGPDTYRFMVPATSG